MRELLTYLLPNLQFESLSFFAKTAETVWQKIDTMIAPHFWCLYVPRLGSIFTREEILVYNSAKACSKVEPFASHSKFGSGILFSLLTLTLVNYGILKGRVRN